MKRNSYPNAALYLIFFAVLSMYSILFTSCAPKNLRNIAGNATDPLNLADTEPSIAVNPLNPMEIAVVTFSEGWSAATGAPVWKSVDGGVTWTKERILPPATATSAGPGDQKIQFDRNGNLFIAELAGGVSPPRCLIYRQTGAINTPLTPGGFYGDDQPMLDIDNNALSGFVGSMYSAWLNFALANEQSTVARSTDLGVTPINVGAGTNTAFSEQNNTQRRWH